MIAKGPAPATGRAPSGSTSSAGSSAGPGPPFRAVNIRAGPVTIAADLAIPARACGVVLLAHAHGSSRHSPRNRTIAARFYNRGLAPLLLDLLTREEEAMDLQTGEWRFDVELLAERIGAATRWLKRQPKLGALPVLYFGGGTAAAAAIVSAAQLRDGIAAVVCFGGRADLAGESLPRVPAPTLLIAGGLDEEVIVTSKDAMTELRCEKALRVVPGATHLFETPAALTEAADLAGDWFLKHLPEHLPKHLAAVRPRQSPAFLTKPLVPRHARYRTTSTEH